MHTSSPFPLSLQVIELRRLAEFGNTVVPASMRLYEAQSADTDAAADAASTRGAGADDAAVTQTQVCMHTDMIVINSLKVFNVSGRCREGTVF